MDVSAPAQLNIAVQLITAPAQPPATGLSCIRPCLDLIGLLSSAFACKNDEGEAGRQAHARMHARHVACRLLGLVASNKAGKIDVTVSPGISEMEKVKQGYQH